MLFLSEPRRLILLIGLLGLLAAAPVLGAPTLQPTNDASFSAIFTGEIPTAVTDLGGNLVGDGVHTGEVKCRNGHCHKKTQLDLNLDGSIVTFEYQFRDLVALDTADLRAIVTGTGKLLSSGPPARFTFTATIQDNADGTVSVTYVASRPDASFIIPASPGTVDMSG